VAAILDTAGILVPTTPAGATIADVLLTIQKRKRACRRTGVIVEPAVFYRLVTAKASTGGTCLAGAPLEAQRP